MALIPLLVEGLAGLRRDKTQEIVFGAIANQVKVQSGLSLVRQAAEHVEVDDQPHSRSAQAAVSP